MSSVLFLALIRLGERRVAACWNRACGASDRDGAVWMGESAFSIGEICDARQPSSDLMEDLLRFIAEYYDLRIANWDSKQKVFLRTQEDYGDRHT